MLVKVAKIYHRSQGSEDGVKHCSMAILYALRHTGCVIPPRAGARWIGRSRPQGQMLALGLPTESCPQLPTFGVVGRLR
jgi:hypothetical protein